MWTKSLWISAGRLFKRTLRTGGKRRRSADMDIGTAMGMDMEGVDGITVVEEIKGEGGTGRDVRFYESEFSLILLCCPVSWCFLILRDRPHCPLFMTGTFEHFMKPALDSTVIERYRRGASPQKFIFTRIFESCLHFSLLWFVSSSTSKPRVPFPLWRCKQP